MKKLLLPLLLFVVLLSGCIDQGGLLYKNDLISLEHFSVYPKNPYAGSIVTLQFYVKNNGNLPVERASVEFSLAGGAFSVQELRCQDGTSSGNSCQFTNLELLDMKKVTFVIKAPTDIKALTPFTISYKVSYDTSSYRQANIPIVDGVERTAPSTKYKESSPTYGPIQADFEPPVGMETIENNKVIKEYWGTEGQPFLLKVNFKDVASSTVGKAKKFTLPAGAVSLTLNNVQAASGLPCDFEGGVSKKEVKVPGSLFCNFIPSDLTQVEGTAVIGVNFDYTYEYEKSITLNVMPVENT
jgi:hypothetical protein